MPLEFNPQSLAIPGGVIQGLSDVARAIMLGVLERDERERRRAEAAAAREAEMAMLRNKYELDRALKEDQHRWDKELHALRLELERAKNSDRNRITLDDAIKLALMELGFGVDFTAPNPDAKNNPLMPLRRGLTEEEMRRVHERAIQILALGGLPHRAETGASRITPEESEVLRFLMRPWSLRSPSPQQPLPNIATAAIGAAGAVNSPQTPNNNTTVAGQPQPPINQPPNINMGEVMAAFDSIRTLIDRARASSNPTDKMKYHDQIMDLVNQYKITLPPILDEIKSVFGMIPNPSSGDQSRRSNKDVMSAVASIRMLLDKASALPNPNDRMRYYGQVRNLVKQYGIRVPALLDEITMVFNVPITDLTGVQSP